MDLIFKKILSEAKLYAIIFIVSIIIVFGLRVFVFTSIISIPSGSMEPKVLIGDKIIATKMIPGPRFFKNIRKLRAENKVETKRLKGIRGVKRNDVLVFNYPYSEGWDKIEMNLNVLYLKRCVALPNDTFSIENGIYRVKNYTDSLGCFFRQHEYSQKSREFFLDGIWNCFPYDSLHYQWNIKNFGPLYVPKSGSTVVLDTLNYLQYKKLIEYETDKSLSVREGFLFLDHERISNYTFQLNYYFMAGDQILDSKDSRYWGLLPEDCIIGKAILVWKSVEQHSGKIRWNRFLKKIT